MFLTLIINDLRMVLKDHVTLKTGVTCFDQRDKLLPQIIDCKTPQIDDEARWSLVT